jgi:hypothetical protein
MVRKSLLCIFILSTNILFGQLEINKNIIGPSAGFSFLESTLQLGINHEYNIDLTSIGIKSAGVLGVGGIFRYWNYSEKFRDFQWDYTNILFGIQTNYHFYFHNDNIDPWLGVVIAYDFGNADLKITNSNVNVTAKDYGGMFIGAAAGIRYWISQDIGVNVRIGIGSSSYGALELGIDYQLK